MKNAGITKGAPILTNSTGLAGRGFDSARRMTSAPLAIDESIARVEAGLDAFPSIRGAHFKVLETISILLNFHGRAIRISRDYLESSNHDRFLADGLTEPTFERFRVAMAFGCSVAFLEVVEASPANLLVSIRALLKGGDKFFQRHVTREVTEVLGEDFAGSVRMIKETLQEVVPELERRVASRLTAEQLRALGLSFQRNSDGNGTDFSFAKPLLGLDGASRDVLLSAGAAVLRMATADAAVRAYAAATGRDPDRAGFQRGSSISMVAAHVRASTIKAMPESRQTPEWLEHTQHCATWVILFSSQWALNGFPQISPTHKLAASNMATAIPRDLVPEIWLPWKSFLVEVPSGLLDEDVRHVGVMDCAAIDETTDELGVDRKGEKAAGRLLLLFPHLSARPRVYIFDELADLAELRLGENIDQAVMGEKPLADRAREGRLLEMLGRLLLGSLIELDAEEHKKQVSSRGNLDAMGALKDERVKRGDKLPTAWLFTIRRDIKHDVRDYVGEYLEGNGKRLSVQVLVRGHRKRQAYGPKGSLRKWIHVEPYWRGPEDAPIVLRSHVVGERSTADGGKA